MPLLQSFMSQQEQEHSGHNIPVFQCTAHGAAASSLPSILLVCFHACPVKLIPEIQLPDSDIQE